MRWIAVFARKSTTRSITHASFASITTWRARSVLILNLVQNLTYNRPRQQRIHAHSASQSTRVRVCVRLLLTMSYANTFVGLKRYQKSSRCTLSWNRFRWSRWISCWKSKMLNWKNGLRRWVKNCGRLKWGRSGVPIGRISFCLNLRRRMSKVRSLRLWRGWWRRVQKGVLPMW